MSAGASIPLGQKPDRDIGRGFGSFVGQITQDIIDNGGMLTADGKRYRTPGGIYLQLVKVDETILKCQRNQILIKELYQKQRKNQIKRLVWYI
jgi:hypothetical protein